MRTLTDDGLPARPSIEEARSESPAPPEAGPVSLPSTRNPVDDSPVDSADDLLAQEAIMSPEASPWRTQKVNRRPLIVLGALAVGLCGLMGYAAVERIASSKNDNSLRAATGDEPALPRGTDSKRMAEDIIGAPHVGLIPDAQEDAPALAPKPVATIEPRAPLTSLVDEPPRPPPRAQSDDVVAEVAKSDDEWRQTRVSALREALVSPRTVRFDRRAAEPPQGDFVQRELARVAQQRAALGGPTDATTAYQQAAAQAAQLMGGAPPSAAHALPMATSMPFAAGPPNAGPASTSSRNDLRAFGTGGTQERWRLSNQIEHAESPYMLLPGDILPAVLDSAINSELPGPITGHVAKPVYSSTGSHELLVPPGTKIFGEYSADVVFGQNRLLVAWQLLRFPDGATLDIGAMPGTDGVGRAGFEDQVDNHLFRLFGSALLLSLVTTGATMAQNPAGSANSDRMSVGGAMSQALGLQLGQVTAQLLQKNLNIAPTLDIRSGFRFNIVVTKKVSFARSYRR